MAEQHGPSGCRMLRDALLAKYGREGVLQDQQNTGKSFISLSQPADTGANTVEYRLTLDVEGKAVLEAAIGPLSAPQPVEGNATSGAVTGAVGTRSWRSSGGRSRPGRSGARTTRPPWC